MTPVTRSLSSRSLITTAELRGALERALFRRRPDAPQVIEVVRRPSRYATSATLEDVHARLDSGEVLHLMLKDMSKRALLDDARATKPRFLYDPRREIETYRTILADGDLGTATCFAAAAEEQTGRYWLLLEKVPGLELYQFGELYWRERAAAALATLHERLASKLDSVGPAVPLLLVHDRRFYALWMRRAQRFVVEADGGRRAAMTIAWLAARHESLVERLLDLPVGLIHGEFYDSNILVQETASGVRVCPVDWEMAALGPGLTDLAALTSGDGGEKERTAVALAYRSALVPRRGWSPDRDAFLRAVDCCRLQLCLQWLGWSRRWAPPPEHARDWLGEAVVLAEKLGI
jgi:aminoglycoside phosphotransferase (APT) family kinase protein